MFCGIRSFEKHVNSEIAKVAPFPGHTEMEREPEGLTRLHHAALAKIGTENSPWILLMSCSLQLEDTYPSIYFTGGEVGVTTTLKKHFESK